MYNFPWLPPSHRENTQLQLDSFDLTTGEHIHDRLIHDFSPETVLYQSFATRGLTVYTAAAAYLFNHDFELVYRVPWPQEINTGWMYDRWTLNHIVLNDDFTKLAYAGIFGDVHGIYLFDLSADTPPALIKEQVPVDTERWADWQGDLMERPSPVMFLEGERLFVSVGFWTGWELFRLIDFDGNVLGEFPFHASSAYGGGFAFTNPAMVIFEPGHSYGPHYFDFDEGILYSAGWWGRCERESWNSYIPDPNNPRVWYVSNSWWSVEQDGAIGVVTEWYSSILRLDFENKTVEPLLLATDTTITLLSVGLDGELVFAHSARGLGGGFAVFTVA